MRTIVAFTGGIVVHQVWRRARIVALAVVAALLLRPDVALACPVCFGAAEGPVAEGVNLAIVALLGITMTVLAGFACFFVYLMRRARLARLAEQWGDDVLESRV